MFLDERFHDVIEVLTHLQRVGNMFDEKTDIWVIGNASEIIKYYPRLGWINTPSPAKLSKELKKEKQRLNTEIACMLGAFGHLLPMSAVQEIALMDIEQWGASSHTYCYVITGSRFRKLQVMEWCI